LNRDPQLLAKPPALNWRPAIYVSFVLMPKTTQPGKWYLVVDCAKCGEAIPFEEVSSPEELPELQYRTVSGLECPHCGYEGIYAAGLVSRRPG
jgi:predicted nucleic-acid-binding Zn-ribbon protein